MAAFEDCFAIPSSSLPKRLQGRGKLTSLATIRKKTQKSQKREEKSPAEILKNERGVLADRYAQNPKNIEYSQEREDLIDEAYRNFGKIFESAAFNEREF